MIFTANQLNNFYNLKINYDNWILNKKKMISIEQNLQLR